MPEDLMHRLFIAVNLSEENREGIWKEISLKLKKGGKKLVEKENLHITLGFLGNYSENGLRELIEKLREIKFNGFEIKFGKTGHFHKNTLWLGLAQGDENIIQIQKEINEIVGIKEKDERLGAHLTVARVKFWKNAEELNDFLKLRFDGRQKIESFELMESFLSGKGPTYKVVESLKASG